MLYQNLICTWNIIDDSHKILLGICLLIFGIIGLGLNIWLFTTFLRSDFLTSRSYLFLLAFCTANLVKGILILPFSSVAALFSRWIFGYGLCQLTAFLKLMLGIFQLLIFALLAIERFLSIPYYKRDIEISFSFYLVSIVMCWTIATTVASLPLAQIGYYIYDTTCTSCELDWKMKNDPQIGLNVSTLVVGGAIPIIIILVFLPIALSKERYIISSKRYEQRMITKCVAVMTSLTFLFWFPRALLIFWIPFIKTRIPKALAVMAPLSVEAATIIPVLTYLVYLPALRNALITILAKKRYQNGQ